jgi:hypothetical protein
MEQDQDVVQGEQLELEEEREKIVRVAALADRRIHLEQLRQVEI